MTCPDHQKIVTAFTIGYFTMFLKDRLIEGDNSFDSFIQSFIITNKEEIKETIFKLYENLFEERYSDCYYENCIEEIKSSIEKVIQVISDRLEKKDDSFLELAFLSGSFLSVASTVELDQIDRNKFEAICSDLLNSLKLSFTWAELKKILSNLTSKTLGTGHNSRDELFAAIANSQSNYEKVFSFQSSIDNLIYQRAFLHFAKASKFFA